jgi:hypothetical protein
VDTRGSPGQAVNTHLKLARSFRPSAVTTVDPDNRLALTRRKYWHDMYTAAVLGNDETTAGHALRVVQHYDQLLALIKGEQQ